METVRLILQILLLIFAIGMIVIVLMQSSQSSGLGSAFGGDNNASTSLGGARGRAASKEAKLKKLTIAIAIVLGVLSIAMVILH